MLKAFCACARCQLFRGANASSGLTSSSKLTAQHVAAVLVQGSLDHLGVVSHGCVKPALAMLLTAVDISVVALKVRQRETNSGQGSTKDALLG